MIFVYHYRKFWRNDLPVWLIRHINEYHLGVSVFFVLSGFLIAYTYEDRPLQSRKEFGLYYLARVIRVFPLYLIILTAKYIDNGFPASGLETFVNYSLTKGLFDGYILSGIPQSWSLTTELVFYALAPWFYKYIKQKVYYGLWLMLLTLLSFSLLGFVLHQGSVPTHGFLYPFWPFVCQVTFGGRAFEFICGMILAYGLKENKIPAFIADFPHKTVTGMLLALVITVGISLFQPTIYVHGIDHWIGFLLRNFLYPVAIAYFIYGLVIEQTWIQKGLSTTSMQVLGVSSYSFYLIHINYVAMRLFKYTVN